MARGVSRTTVDYQLAFARQLVDDHPALLAACLDAEGDAAGSGGPGSARPAQSAWAGVVGDAADEPVLDVPEVGHRERRLGAPAVPLVDDEQHQIHVLGHQDDFGADGDWRSVDHDQVDALGQPIQQ